MKKNIIVCLFLISITGISETLQEKEECMKPALWLNIIDPSNCTLPYESIGYGDLPTEIEYRGILVEALKWTDNSGLNILILTQTGGFNRKDSSHAGESRSELFVYLFQKLPKQPEYSRRWKLTDFQNCDGVDMYAGFYEKNR